MPETILCLPPGVFNWQCVTIMCHQTVRHSSTRAFIGFFIYPFRAALDSSEGETSEDLDKNPPYPGILRIALTDIFSDYRRAIGPKSIAKKYCNRFLTSHLTLVECSLALLWSNADLTCVMQDVQPEGTRPRRGADSSGDGCCGDGTSAAVVVNYYYSSLTSQNRWMRRRRREAQRKVFDGRVQYAGSCIQRHKSIGVQPGVGP